MKFNQQWILSATIALLVCSCCFSQTAQPSTNAISQSRPKGMQASGPVNWALRPVKRPEIPAPANRAWTTRNPIDAFIQASLQKKQLSPTPEAERRILIRRLYFDLLGLPPDPQAVIAFQQDTAHDAYERLVERLLASPQYGECWASHWLDVVRFSETQGFEMNNPRPNAWPYRDYVIRSFNEDKPYDRFIREQLAGDVFGVDAATGFLVAGPWDQVKSPDPVLTATQRADELHDMVSTTASAFLGLTVGCARCHDHKFDPIPQKDYYSLKACLEGVQHGERPLRMEDAASNREEASQAKRALAKIDSELAIFEPLAHPTGCGATNALRPPVNARRNVEKFEPVRAKRLRFTITATTDAEPCIDELEVYALDPTQGNVALAANGAVARASSVFPNSEIHRLEHINDGLEGNSHSWISNERGRGWIELEFPQILQISRVQWGRDHEQKFRDRLATEYRIDVSTNSDDWRTIASSADRQPYDPKLTVAPESLFAGLPQQELRRAQDLSKQRSILEARLQDLSRTPMVYAGTFNSVPAATHRLNRGDPMQETEVVEPGALGIIPVNFTLKPRALDAALRSSDEASKSNPQLTSDQQRRLALADWIAAPSNPLPSRVLVNRLWLYHFGEGLVSTPSDFGRNGAQPSHPELLDWLALELIHPTASSAEKASPQPWSIKHIQRLIVMSATYRQSSQSRNEARKIDAATRLLWRFPPRRLEAETLRDSILSVSGHLDCQIGGAGFSGFEPNDNYVRVYAPRTEFGPTEWRRMIYMTKVRMQQDGTFGAFDCPDGGQIAPKRMRSITPLQALNLLNSSFIVQQAELFAERLTREAGPDLRAQLDLAFQLAFNRAPEARESAAAAKLAAEHGLPVLCRALFNSNEFVFLD